MVLDHFLALIILGSAVIAECGIQQGYENNFVLLSFAMDLIPNTGFFNAIPRIFNSPWLPLDNNFKNGLDVSSSDRPHAGYSNAMGSKGEKSQKELS